jgi:hypothetical protein
MPCALPDAVRLCLAATVSWLDRQTAAMDELQEPRRHAEQSAALPMRAALSPCSPDRRKIPRQVVSGGVGIRTHGPKKGGNGFETALDGGMIPLWQRVCGPSKRGALHYALH